MRDGDAAETGAGGNTDGGASSRAGRADGSGVERTELRISVDGTHTRRQDLEALQEWLKNAPDLKDAITRDEATLERRDSLDPPDKPTRMGPEVLHDIVLVVIGEAARPVAESAWRSVLTWVRNRRRLAVPDEDPHVTLDCGGTGPGGNIRRDSREGPNTAGGTISPIPSATSPAPPRPDSATRPDGAHRHTSDDYGPSTADDPEGV